MSSDFASTCALLLPVFGFAAVAEMFVFRWLMSKWFPGRGEWRSLRYWILVLPGVVAYGLWAWLIFRIADEEAACLDALRQPRVAAGSAASVRGTIEAAIALLIVIPAVAALLAWIAELARDRAKAQAKAPKRGPAYLDDEVDLSRNT